MDVPEKILELVDIFDRNRDAYLSGHYKEAEIRSEFINPFFTALGWDVNNEKGYAPQYRDVIHEAVVKVGGVTKAPDYSFRIGGTKKFFLEAKKPSVDIKEDIAPAFQLRRYAWSAKMPLSILTDFEEFAVYDCRVKPVKTDKASNARVCYFTYKEYEKKWGVISDVFSKEAVLKGNYDRFFEDKKSPKEEVDSEFLKEIESWRDLLARNIAIRNPSLTTRDLNFAVQKTIDRIIFLRVCEDRGIDDQGRLMSLLNGENIYRRLIQIYHQADDRFNSGLFHFSRERDRPGDPDTLTLSLDIDDRVLKDIIKDLYYPESPYVFSFIPIDILGQVYEQFLGKVIRLTPSHRAVVEEKPEVKKAGGVYYTPTYIVDYIVDNTVGKLLEGSAPNRVSKMRILDPACGSGSFLIGAYQKLLDWHRNFYEADGVEKHKKELYQGAGGEWKLTTAEKKRILLNNIYGVDIDNQAVEVTKLSLLLKVLEGESEETINTQLKMFKERALPDLGDNIKCGNSLLSRKHLYEFDLFEEEETNPFDWDNEKFGFGTIIKNNGFDCIIGNPPYLKTQILQEFQPKTTELLKRSYISASGGNVDIYIIFIEKALELLSNNGLMGFICPHKFFNSNYGQNLRRIISENRNIYKILNFGINQIFENATNYTCLLFLTKKAQIHFDYYKFDEEIDNLENEVNKGISYLNISSSELSENNWVFLDPKLELLIEKVRRNKQTLEEITSNIFQGPKSGADPVFILEISEKGEKTIRCFSNSVGEEIEIEKGILKPYVKGKKIKRYKVEKTNELIIFPYNEKGILFTEKELLDNYPLAYSYLSRKQNKEILNSREKGRFKKIWWSYSRPQNMLLLDRNKILTPFNAFNSSFFYDTKGGFIFSAGVSGAYGILLNSEVNINYEYLLGILNSSLLEIYLKSISTALRGGFYSFENKYIKQLPIYLPEKSDEDKNKICKEIENNVRKIIELKKDDTKHADVDFLEDKIDSLVYELYGLTDEEIAIVEGEGK
ncbi:MAG: N-6 DNA methylase [Deltaproteobacteria bacterium]|uniref:site-specific DNA-methyltransferase (adenine-specific) n=1 Tax=Candidatus Zymogenus saltonus TaxID=2844893 RepID=A0A9D8PJB0_9DELT|nr:N-6 DNA methylase [Candidatus Zymogenus saltonus]